MKNFSKYLLSGLVAAFTVAPTPGWSGPIIESGFVHASPTSITGSYNIRHNANAAFGSIEYTLSPGFVIIIQGQDSTTGQSFACSLVRSQNPSDFDQYEKALLSLTNGSKLSADLINNRCANILVFSGSKLLD
jgi:hypothetical protein